METDTTPAEVGAAAAREAATQQKAPKRANNLFAAIAQ
jgi:hypothetical protein